MKVSRSIFWPVCGIVVLLLIKIYLQLHFGYTTSEYLHLHRSWTLLHFGQDEMGHFLPFIFSSPSGYEHPLLDYLLVPLANFPFAGFIWELILWFTPAVLLIATYANFLPGFVFMATPIFLWPGYWSAKLFSLFFVLLVTSLHRKSPPFFIIVLSLLFLTSAEAFLLLPIILLGFMIVNHKYWRHFLITLVLSGSIFLLVGLIPGFHKSYITNHFGIFFDSELVTTINSLRGEHIPNILVKLLHNKLSFIYLLLHTITSGINPSFLFGLGDRDIFSLSQKVPLLPITFLPVLLYFLFRSKRAFNMHLWIMPTALFLASLKAPVLLEKQLFIFAVAIILVVGHKFQRILIIPTVLWLGAMAYFSASFLPLQLQIELNQGLIAVTKLPYHLTTLLTDNIYPDPGPFLAYTLKSTPPRVSVSYQSRYYIRQVGPIEIVSPADPRLRESEGIFIVSKDQLSPYLASTYTPISFDNSGQPVLYRVFQYDVTKQP